ncbi:hypothetical protein CYMTET_7293 [Cymbomonas tetramitiformis]|uniref:Uncharacterized protein n=1 Tax=Cymbomonas tetramitiformis TaxID=36881 RepID=A0AAE0GVA6_9CHLO|nr:hypothetical protein CYMTET_7293 [Cymbomonas tetramitiformis]
MNGLSMEDHNHDLEMCCSPVVNPVEESARPMANSVEDLGPSKKWILRRTQITEQIDGECAPEFPKGLVYAAVDDSKLMQMALGQFIRGPLAGVHYLPAYEGAASSIVRGSTKESISGFVEEARTDLEQTKKELITNVRHHKPKGTQDYAGGATIPDLTDTHAEDMAQLLEASKQEKADMTALEAVGEYLAMYEDTRGLPQHRGFPLETPYGAPAGNGKVQYELVSNCTDLKPEEQNELGMPLTGPQITVGPFTEEHQAEVVEYLGHLQAAVRSLHGLGHEEPVLHQQEGVRPRWYADKVAELHIIFACSEYALTTLTTSLVHIPIRCVPLGADTFKLQEQCIPRVRVFNPTQSRGGNEERPLHIISEALRGQTTRELERRLQEMGCIESAIKGERARSTLRERETNSIMDKVAQMN